MKTFHSVPPQSTSVQRTVCVQYWMSKVQIEARSQSSSPPGSQLLPRTPHLVHIHRVHTAAASPLLHPAEDTTRCPPALPWWEARSLWGVPSTLNSRESHGSARTCCTSTSVPGGKQLYSRLHYYMINNPVFPSDNIHNSPAPGIHFFFSDAKCYFTHAAKNSKTSSTKEFIWLLRTNKLAGLFQVSFGSMLKYHDLSSSGFRKGVWLWA